MHMLPVSSHSQNNGQCVKRNWHHPHQAQTSYGNQCCQALHLSKGTLRDHDSRWSPQINTMPAMPKQNQAASSKHVIKLRAKQDRTQIYRGAIQQQHSSQNTFHWGWCRKVLLLNAARPCQAPLEALWVHSKKSKYNAALA